MKGLSGFKKTGSKMTKNNTMAALEAFANKIGPSKGSPTKSLAENPHRTDSYTAEDPETSTLRQSSDMKVGAKKSVTKKKSSKKQTTSKIKVEQNVDVIILNFQEEF